MREISQHDQTQARESGESPPHFQHSPASQFAFALASSAVRAWKNKDVHRKLEPVAVCKHQLKEKWSQLFSSFRPSGAVLQ